MSEPVSIPSQPVWRRRPLSIWLVGTLVVLLLLGGVLVWHFGLRSKPKFVEYPMLHPGDIPAAVAVAPNGAVWFTIDNSDAIGLFRDGKIERFPKGGQNQAPMGLAAASDGSAWFTDTPARVISNITQSGKITSFPLSTPLARLGRLALAPDGSVWFAEQTAYSITRLKDGVFTRHVIGSPRSGPYGVAVGPNGIVWAVLQAGNKLVQILPDGKMTEVDIPTRGGTPTDIVVDTSGTVWFTEFLASKIGRYANGQFTEFPVPGSHRDTLTGLTVAPDGSVWFSALPMHSLFRLRDGIFKQFRLPRPDARPYGITVDTAGNIWYTDISGWLGMLSADQAKAD